MKHKNFHKKAHQLSTILAVIALVISVFSIGFYTENNNSIVYNNQNNENLGNEITGFAIGMEMELR